MFLQGIVIMQTTDRAESVHNTVLQIYSATFCQLLSIIDNIGESYCKNTGLQFLLG